MAAPVRPWLRPVLIATLLLIAISCTASAYFAVQAGRAVRGASTFFAGLAFCALIVFRLPRRS